MQLRKPRISPPTITAGMMGANTSAITVMARCTGFWFCFAAAFAASFDTPSMPAMPMNSS